VVVRHVEEDDVAGGLEDLELTVVSGARDALHENTAHRIEKFAATDPRGVRALLTFPAPTAARRIDRWRIPCPARSGLEKVKQVPRNTTRTPPQFSIRKPVFMQGVPRHLTTVSSRLQPPGYIVSSTWRHHTYRSVPLNAVRIFRSASALEWADSRGRLGRQRAGRGRHQNNDQPWFDVVGSVSQATRCARGALRAISADRSSTPPVITDPSYTRPWT